MENEAELRAQAISRLKRRRDFIRNISSYVLVNGVLWLIWGLNGADTSNFPWPAWVSSIWGFLIFMHAFRAFVRRPISESAIEREMQRLRGG